jgi:phenylpropionate dioxygenase-like ring-hydroxylating dioxygenase large terminal subunit
MSRFPMPRYPNGWFQVAYSDELEPGAVRPLKYFGRDMVLFRTASGQAAVLDAFCPHLGAHLGHGGKVVGESVQCPFHAWSFGCDGQCTEVPYATKIPPRAKVAPWNVVERAGLILVWFHAEGLPPQWEVPQVPEYGNEEWTPYERRSWKIKTHNQEMAENSCDSAHFLYVHGTAGMPSTRVEVKDHLLHMFSETKMTTPMGKVGGSVESLLYGFGFTLTRFKGIVETLLVSSATTIDEDYVEMRFSFTVKKLPTKDVTKTVGRAFIAEIERQVGQDIPIWENKAYKQAPLIVDGDGPLGTFRKWVKQFYSEPKATLPVVGQAPAANGTNGTTASA